jgi:hypothetical protein
MRYVHVAMAAALAVAVAGCGGGGSTSAGATAVAARSGDQRAAFTACLQKNGVTLPSGRPSGRPSDRPTARPSGRPSARPSGGFGGFRSMSPEMQKAFQACASLMPQGGGFRGGNGGGGNGTNASALQAFRTCMKDNGAEIPQGAGFRTIDRNDPKIAKALKTCRPLLPTPAPSPSA